MERSGELVTFIDIGRECSPALPVRRVVHRQFRSARLPRRSTNTQIGSSQLPVGHALAAPRNSTRSGVRDASSSRIWTSTFNRRLGSPDSAAGVLSPSSRGCIRVKGAVDQGVNVSALNSFTSKLRECLTAFSACRESPPVTLLTREPVDSETWSNFHDVSGAVVVVSGQPGQSNFELALQQFGRRKSDCSICAD